MKLNVMKKALIWMNYPPRREQWVLQRRVSNPKRDYFICSPRSMSHASLDEAKCPGEAPTWMNHLPRKEVWVLRRRGSSLKMDYFICSSKRTTQASLDEIEHHGRIRVMKNVEFHMFSIHNARSVWTISCLCRLSYLLQFELNSLHYAHNWGPNTSNYIIENIKT